MVVKSIFPQLCKKIVIDIVCDMVLQLNFMKKIAISHKKILSIILDLHQNKAKSAQKGFPGIAVSVRNVKKYDL